MNKVSKAIAQSRMLILVIAFLLLIPSVLGYLKTDVNYDILGYLPDELDTRIAQSILKDDFDCGSLGMLIVENMEDKDVSKLKEEVKKVEGVNDVIWIDDAIDLSVPKEILPEYIRDIFYSENSTLMIIKFVGTDSSTETENALSDVRKIAGKQAFLSGVAGVIKDTKDLANKETPIYVLIAVILSIIILSITMESYVIPIVFLSSIGIAIIYNMGSNVIFENISYVTKALSAVLQLGVTMDYSIFLLHRYDEERESRENKVEAMANAIEATIESVVGSALTTVAGFLALCVMDLALGKDIAYIL